MNNTASEQKTPNVTETVHHIGGSTYIVRSFYPEKEVMQEMLKRLILREYERRVSTDTIAN
ncbi:hypothetical protein AGMMS49992_31500 [Clostridia bacterium]|nr:hypothetical protein AGMMS49992_31500 [Clostridia bacterium]